MEFEAAEKKGPRQDLPMNSGLLLEPAEGGEADGEVGTDAHGGFRYARAGAGIWFHSRPSSSRPPLLGNRPPHCFKKKATPLAWH